MDGAIPWMVAGALLTLLVVLWHFVAYRDLKEKHDALLGSLKQLEYHQETLRQEKPPPFSPEDEQMVHLSYLFYEKQANTYNTLRKKPFYAIPAALLGFRAERLKPKF